MSSRPSIDFESIKRQADFSQVLQALGWQWTEKVRCQVRGKCPFHVSGSPRPRSFSVELDRKIFRCFNNKCGASGDIFNLVAQLRGVTAYEAALIVKEICGL